MYAKNGTNILCIDKPESCAGFNQFCCFDIVVDDGKCTIYLVYRPPSSSAENGDWLAEMMRTCPANCMLIGDFNLPGINWEELTADSRKGAQFLDACTERGLEQLVTFPTHNKGNTLDLVLTDIPGAVHSVATYGRLGHSDHDMLVVEMELGTKHKKLPEVTKNWRRANWEEMRHELGQKDWQREMDGLGAEDAWQLFKTTVHGLVEKHVPTRVVRTNGRPPWLSNELLQEIRKKRRLWAKYRKSPSQENKFEYEEVAKTVQKKIRRAKRRVEQQLATDTANSKKFYSYIRSKTSTRTGVGPLKVDGRTLTDSREMAEALNEYFGSVFQAEDLLNVPKPKILPTKSKCSGVNFRPSIVKKMIRSLKSNSAPGPDGITPRLLQELVDVVAAPLSTVFTKSMVEGTVPDDWKSAHVTPIFKKGQKSSPTNYRPVSLTSVPGKVMEKVIKESLMSHLKRNNLVKKSQHGFMPNKSCTTNLLVFLESVTKAVDEGKDLDIIYLDFAKAFDLVPRQRLLEKLKAHGVGGELLRWIGDWLLDRKQKVVLNGKSSSWSHVKSGVPQGSILGPILFTIFINDLDEEVVEKVSIILKFADDTKIGHVIDSEESWQALQDALVHLCNWADKWEMRFNVEKCKVLHVGKTNKRRPYTMNGRQLETTEMEKDIGVLVCANLKPGRQCEKAARTANGVLTQVLRALSYRDKTVLPKIYAQYVRPHLEFAVQAWAPWQRGDIELLENVQRRMVRQVTGLQGRLYEERLVELGMDTLEERRKAQDLVQVYKIIHEVDDVDSGTWFERTDQHQNRTRAAEWGLRQSGRPPRLEMRRNFFSQRVIQEWNRLPVDTRSTSTQNEFKSYLKKI